MIVPPDKGMAILLEGDEMMILDSHGHNSDKDGALIIAGKIDEAPKLIAKLEEILNTSLMGSDVTPITLQQ